MVSVLLLYSLDEFEENKGIAPEREASIAEFHVYSESSSGRHLGGEEVFSP